MPPTTIVNKGSEFIASEPLATERGGIEYETAEKPNSRKTRANHTQQKAILTMCHLSVYLASHAAQNLSGAGTPRAAAYAQDTGGWRFL
jgi:hypothetical protein